MGRYSINFLLFFVFLLKSIVLTLRIHFDFIDKFYLICWKWFFLPITWYNFLFFNNVALKLEFFTGIPDTRIISLYRIKFTKYFVTIASSLFTNALFVWKKFCKENVKYWFIQVYDKFISLMTRAQKGLYVIYKWV